MTSLSESGSDDSINLSSWTDLAPSPKEAKLDDSNAASADHHSSNRQISIADHPETNDGQLEIRESGAAIGTTEKLQISTADEIYAIKHAVIEVSWLLKIGYILSLFFENLL